MQASIRAITGMQFTSENFVRLWELSLPQPQRTSPGVPALITAADAEHMRSVISANAEATPRSAEQIVAFDAVGVLTRTAELEPPRGTWRISRSS
jgi:hypothetical protein